jgi:hypothetical protein
MGAEDDGSAALIAKMLAKDERAMQADTAPVGKKHKGKRRGSDDDVRRPSSIQLGFGDGGSAAMLRLVEGAEAAHCDPVRRVV